MKRRLSFVANSSSSSFLIMGNVQKISPEEFRSMYPDKIKEAEDDGYPLDDYELHQLHADATDLDVYPVDEDYEEYYVGSEIMSCSGRESITIKAFETRYNKAKQLLEEKGITDYKLYFGERNS